MDFRLQQRVVVVTGGSSGVGLSTVRRLLDEGGSVVACARDEPWLRDMTADLDGQRLLIVGRMRFVSVRQEQAIGSDRGVIHGTRDQIGMLRAVSKEARSVAAGDVTGTDLQEFAAAALALPSGPTSVEWPIDLQYLDGPSGATPPEAPPPALDEEQLFSRGSRAAGRSSTGGLGGWRRRAGPRCGFSAARRHGSRARHEQLRPGGHPGGRPALHRQHLQAVQHLDAIRR
jgi:hypothetical protein